MFKKLGWIILAICILAAVLSAIGVAVRATRFGGITGIYAVCKPKGYDVVCFGDTGGSDGGIFCMKLSDAAKDSSCK
jgi:hypothetical protein